MKKISKVDKKKNLFKAKLAISLTLCSGLLLQNSVQAVDRIVPAPYSTIKDAILAAVSGDNILIDSNGTINSNADLTSIINQSITIKNSLGMTPTLNMYSNVTTNNHLIFAGGITNTSNIEGLTIKAGFAPIAANLAAKGGAILNNSAVTLNIASVIFDTNRGVQGGAIYNDGGIVNLNSGTEFKLNVADYGGGVYNKDGTVNVNAGVTMSGNGNTKVAISGGAIFNEGDNAVINVKGTDLASPTTKVIFQNYKVQDGIASTLYAAAGGAIANKDEKSTLNIDYAEFLNNQAALGGAIYNNGKMTIKNSLFDSNKVDNLNSGGSNHGGAIYNDGKGVVYIYDTTFNKNSTANTAKGGHGGAVMNNGWMKVVRSTFTNNTSNGWSPAILSSGIGKYEEGQYQGAYLIIEDSYFYKNSTTGGGGAVGSSDYGDLKISGSKIEENSGRYGGGMYIETTVTSEKNTYLNNTASTGGGAVYSSGEFALGPVPELGDTYGKMYFNSTEDTFDGNKSNGFGGAIYMDIQGPSYIVSTYNYSDQNKLALKKGIVKNNEAVTNGGAIYALLKQGTTTLPDFNRKLTLEISDTKFTSNKAGQNGGAIYITGSYAGTIKSEIKNSEFDSNTVTTTGTTSTLSGGMLYQAMSGSCVAETILENLTVKNGNITINRTTAGTGQGGIIYNTGSTSTITIDGGEFTDNYIDVGGMTGTASANARGGGIYNASATTMGITNAKFTGTSIKAAVDSGTGTSTAEGGIIYNNAASTLNIENVEAKNTTVQASASGTGTTAARAGGIYNAGGGTLNISNSKFEGATVKADGGIGTATAQGGAIYNTGTNSKVIISDTTFDSNEVSASGTGAVYSQGGVIYNATNITGQPTIDIKAGNTFNKNSAFEGGVIYSTTGNIDIDSSTFTNNKATSTISGVNANGGVIFRSGGTVDITGSTFTGNSADNFGGVMYVSGAGNNTINGTTTFTSNSAKSGGAIYNLGTIYVYGGSTFTSNSATADGGAIYNAGTLYLTSTLGDIKFSGNQTGAVGSEVGNDIYNEASKTINVNGTANDVVIGGGFKGEGTINKTGAGRLLIDGDSSGYTGVFASTAGETIVSATGKMFGGVAANNKISTSTLQVTGDSVYYNVQLGASAILNHFSNSADWSDVDPAKITFAGTGTTINGIKMTFDKDPLLTGNAQYNLLKKIDNTRANSVTFKNSDVTLGATDFTGTTTYNLVDSTLDLSTHKPAPGDLDPLNRERGLSGIQTATKFTNLNLNNATLSFDVGFNKVGTNVTLISDQLDIVNAPGDKTINLGAVKVLKDIDYDDGMHDTDYQTTVLKGTGNVTFATPLTPVYTATTVYEYLVGLTSDSKGITLDAYRAADEYSLNAMNILSNTTRGFNFSYLQGGAQTYNIGDSLDAMGKGIFTVQGYDNDPTNCILSGALVDSTGTLTGSNGSFFNLSGTDAIDFTLKNLTVQDAEGANGSVLAMNDINAVATLENLIIQNNESTGSGGAIYNAAGTTTIKKTTFDGNTSGGFGGAIYNAANLTLDTSLGDIVFTNNTDNTSANDIYNTGTMNITGTIAANKVTMDGGIKGAAAGIINKSSAGLLQMDGDSSGYLGTFNSTGGKTVVSATGEMFGGTNNISTSTVEVTSSTLSYGANVGTSGILDHISTAASSVNIDNSKFKFTGNNGKMTFESGLTAGDLAEYNLANDIASAGTNNKVEFKDSIVTLGSNTYTGNSIYSFVDSTLDLRSSAITTTTMKNLDTDNTTLNFDINFNATSPVTLESDKLIVTNATGDKELNLGIIAVLNDNDDGQQGTYQTNVLTGIKFKNLVTPIDIATTAYLYKMTLANGNKDILLDAYSEADEYSLNLMNIKSNSRGFNFSYLEGSSQNYHIGASLDQMAAGTFVVQGYNNDPTSSILSGALVDSTGTLTGSNGYFFNVSGAAATNFTLKNLTVQDAEKTDNGSVLSMNNANAVATLENLIIQNNESTGDGGAIYNSVGTTTIKKTTFDGNTSGGVGGAIYNTATLNLDSSLGNIVFTNNTYAFGDNDIYNSGIMNIVGNTNKITMDGGIIGVVPGVINKTGGNIVEISGNSSGYRGTFNQSAGQTIFSAAYFGNGGAGKNNITGGILELTTGSSLPSISVINLGGNADLNITGTVNLTLGANQIQGYTDGFGTTYGDINKTSTGLLTITGDNFGFEGDFNQTAGTTTVTSAGAMFGGTNTIKDSTLNVTGSSLYYKTELDDNGVLNHYNTTATTSNISTASNFKFIGEDAVANFGKDSSLGVANANYNLVNNIVNGTKENTIAFTDSNVTFGASDYRGSTTYSFTDSLIDLDNGALASTQFTNLDIDNVTLDFDAKFVPNGPNDVKLDSDKLIAASVNGGLGGEITLGVINLINAPADNGMHDTYTTNVLTGNGLTFAALSSPMAIFTNIYEYEVDLTADKKGIIIDAQRAADEYSLNAANIKDGTRGFNFQYLNDTPDVQEYHIGDSLDVMEEGTFVVQGFDANDPSKSVLSGALVDSTGTPTGSNGYFFNIDSTSGTVDFTLKNLTVTEAEKTGSGSVLSMDNNTNATAKIQNVIIDSNSSTVNGGAISAVASGALTIEGTQLNSNIADALGGAIYIENNTLNIGAGTSFDSNDAGVAGGAIYNNGGTVNLTSSATGDIVFTGNTDATGSNGIYNDNGTININGSAGTVQINDGIAGTGSIVKSNGGILELIDGSINSSYTGTFTQKAGGGTTTVHGDFFGGESTILGGTLNWLDNADKASTASLAVTGGTINIGTSTTGSTLNLDNANDVLSKNAVINLATDSILNNSAGKVTFNSNDSWLGEVNLTGTGKVTLDEFDKNTTTGTYSQSGGELILNKSDFTLGGLNTITGGDLTVNSGSRLFFDQGTSLTVDNFNVNSGSVNSANGVIENHIIAGNMNVTGKTYFSIDIDPSTAQYDTYSIAGNMQGPGTIYLAGVNFLSNDLLKTSLTYNIFTASNIPLDITFAEPNIDIKTPYGKYRLYSNGDGSYSLRVYEVREPSFRGTVATMAAYNNQLTVNNAIFDHVYLDSEDLMLYNKNVNRYASSTSQFAPYQYSTEDSSIWFKSYASFETLSMTHGLDVDNNAYGSIIGVDLRAMSLKHGWKFLPTLFMAYNGGHQSFNGVSLYQNGGQGGLMGTFMRGDFITSILTYAGGYGNETQFGGENDVYGNWFAGVAGKAAYNFHPTPNIIIQPNALVSYNAFGKVDHNSNIGAVNMTTGMLNGINVAPGLNFIYGRETWSIYATTQYMYFINDDISGRLGNLSLPDVNMRHGYFEYGIGATKTWKERLIGYAQVVLRNGGRTGVGLQLGFTWRF